MKVAICISGNLRQFKSCAKSYAQNIIWDQNNQYDVYISTWDQVIANIKDNIKDEGSIQEALDFFKPKASNVEKYTELKKQHLYTITGMKDFQKSLKCNKKGCGLKCGNCAGKLIHNMIGMLYNIYKCFELVEKSGIKYDTIIRIRPDNLYFQKLCIPDIEPQTVYVPAGYDSLAKYGGGINDQMAVGDYEGMAHYSYTFHKIKDLMKYSLKFHNGHGLPHRALERHMQENNVNIKRFDFRYVIYRKLDIFMRDKALKMTPEQFAGYSL